MKVKKKKIIKTPMLKGFLYKKKNQVKHTGLCGLVHQGLEKATTIKFSFSNITR